MYHLCPGCEIETFGEMLCPDCRITYAMPKDRQPLETPQMVLAVSAPDALMARSSAWARMRMTLHRNGSESALAVRN